MISIHRCKLLTVVYMQLYGGSGKHHACTQSPRL